ncbi:MacB family efflux pump subunit [Rarobacter faecitabidus]|uniref:ABC-type lipoprotein export system ATPase subunit n=2 Tax=Bacteria TaxID=2 RepID=A0A542ZTF5_RARFA|nr:ABC transporter permease [Rarobacter faecitabidus]TQL63644.1 ABC-type lipoprotein export system ATPase subunit [Rarobacter faecitabidus]
MSAVAIARTQTGSGGDGASPVIELIDGRKTYRTGAIEFEAMRGVDLTVNRGDYVAITGPSGSGKSTLMNVLGCLDVLTSGSYRIAGQVVSDLDESSLATLRNEEIGFVFQQFHLLPSLSALRNVELPLAYRGTPRAERHERARAALDRVGLGDKAANRPGELSGGQQQRVAVARALVGEPALLLADEPTGNLDTASTGDVLALLDELHEQGRTIVLITHEQEVAARAAPGAHARRTGPAGGRGATVNWQETTATAWHAIRSHGMRSLLTVLGILIGIAAVILTVGLGLGTQKDVSEQISSLGSNLLIVTPGSSTDSSGMRGGFGSGATLTTQDVAALSSAVAVPDVANVAAEKSSSLSVTAGDTNWTTTVTGVTSDWLTVRSRSVALGAFVDQQATDEVVLGSAAAEELFGTTFVIGQSVTINDADFTVVGVLAEQGSNSTSNLDDLAIVSMPAMADTIVGGTDRRSVSTIYLKASDTSTISAAKQEAEQLLLNLHAITDADNADFTITSQDSLVDTATAVYQTLTVLLAGIAGLSLLVGGIGVMNIMLVSVTERTREIGLRKALGAPPRAIRRQFLVEASILGLTGGLMGAVIGIVAARVLPALLGSSVIVSPLAVGGSIGIAIAIGLIFGVYPAIRAARLAPIDALRAE